MSLLSRILDGADRRSSTFEDPNPQLLEALGAVPSYSGKSVTVENSTSLIPVFSAVSRLAGAVGALPLVVYRRLDQGRERAEDHWCWPLCHDQPNPEMAADELWETVEASLLLWGNAFIGKIRGPLGRVTELWPIRPSRVQVGKDDQGNRYFVLDGRGRYTEEDILHIRGLGTDGLVGLSPVQQARQHLGNQMALEEFSGRFWGNSANPGGVLTHPNKLSTDAAERLQGRWKKLHGGTARAGEVAVLEEGMKWESVGMPLEDAQFIQTAQYGDLRVAQLFNLPPYMLGAKTGDSLTYSTVESQSIDFVRWSLRRWLVRIEKSLSRDPSLFVQGQRFYPEFLIDAVLRADTKTRYEAYKLGLDAGFLERDEVREWENLNPLPDPQPGEPSTPSDPAQNGSGDPGGVLVGNN